MKKSYLALSLLAVSTSAAWAQTSSVTLYGVVDAGINYTSGLKGGAKKQVVSGIMDGSRLGVRGTEDLGGGYRAIFTLENRLEADTGSTSNLPSSGSQLPDRMVQQALIFTPTNFSLPAAIPAATQALLIGGARGALNGGLQRAVEGVGAQVGQTLGVNVGNARFWDRQAYVGLVTPVGAVLVGRQYTPAYLISVEFDIMGTQSSLAAGQVGAVPSLIDIRQSNAVQYVAEMSGFRVAAMAAAGEGSSAQGRFLSASATYKMDGYAVGFGYNTKQNEAGQRSLKSTVFGASANLGPGKLSFLYGASEDKNPSGIAAAMGGFGGAVGQIKAGIAASPSFNIPLGGGATVGSLLASQVDASSLSAQYKSIFVQDSVLMSLGYKIVTGSHTFYTAYNKFNDKTRFNADVDSYGGVYTYAFSKRTDVNFVLTHFSNKGLGQAAPGQAGFLGGVTESAGKDANNFAVGLRHRF